ncbi:hypothetical protein CapIbe_013516 [Capra ibex]
MSGPPGAPSLVAACSPTPRSLSSASEPVGLSTWSPWHAARRRPAPLCGWVSAWLQRVRSPHLCVLVWCSWVCVQVGTALWAMRAWTLWSEASTSVWPERTKPARTKVVFSIIATGVKAVNITQNQKEKGRTALGQVWGEETGPALLSAIPGGYRNPLTSALRTQQAETWGPNQGSSTPGAGSGDCVGLTPSTWVRILYPETPNLRFTCSVSCSR